MKRVLIPLFTVLFVSSALLTQAAQVSKGIHVGNAGSFTGDAAAPCM